VKIPAPLYRIGFAAVLSIGKLLGLTALTGVVRHTWATQRFLSGMLNVIILAILSSIMLAALIAGAILTLYTGLLNSGWDSGPAAMLSIGLLAAITAILFALTLLHMKNLRSEVEMAMKGRGTETSGSSLSKIFLSFLDGFSERQKP
jgi:hypothetical protein